MIYISAQSAGMVVHVGVSSMVQIKLFNHLFYLKPFNSVQIELLVFDCST